MYEGFKGGPHTRYVHCTQGVSETRARIQDCLHRGDKISIPKFVVCSNANDLSKDVFRAVSSKEEISAQFNRCNNSYEIFEGGKLETRHWKRYCCSLSFFLLKFYEIFLY